MNRRHRILEIIMEQIKSHIKSFPANESHYLRKDTVRKYLSPDLSVATMHDMYLQKYEADIHQRRLVGEAMKPQVSYKVYRRIFNTCFNLSFGRPRSNTCATCDELNIKIEAEEKEEEKKSFRASLELHHRKSERFYDEIQKDTKRSKEDPSFEVVTFDFQQNLPMPHIPVSDIFYLRQLWLYIFGTIQPEMMMGLCIAGQIPQPDEDVMK